MTKKQKLLERMRQNPRDWSIGDVASVCAAFGIDFETPRRGSHYGVSHGSQAEILTVPFDRPIKQVYIKKLVGFVDAVQIAQSRDEKGDDSD